MFCDLPFGLLTETEEWDVKWEEGQIQNFLSKCVGANTADFCTYVFKVEHQQVAEIVAAAKSLECAFDMGVLVKPNTSNTCKSFISLLLYCSFGHFWCKNRKTQLIFSCKIFSF